jgi:superfamily II DNA or RNA helicase
VGEAVSLAMDWTAPPPMAAIPGLDAAEDGAIAREADAGPEAVPASVVFTPHPYQRAAFDAIWGRWDAGDRSTLASMPTGSGKTILFGMVAKEGIEARGGRVLVLAHRDELLEQAQAKLAYVGVDSAIEKAEQRARVAIEMASRDYFHPRDIRCVVGSVQTLRGKRLESWPRDYFEYIVVDEGHHLVKGVGPKHRKRTIVNAQYGGVLDHFSAAKVLVVTATPRRMDGGNLGKVCDSIAFEYLIAEAIDDGYLAPCDFKKSEFEIDLGFINHNAGELNQGDLEDRVRPHIEPMVNFIKENVGTRRGLLFAPGRRSVDQAIRPCTLFADALAGVGITARAVWGDHPDRLAILREFRDGGFQFLCNADLLTEGYDAPFVEAVAICRCTMSDSLLAQMIGRGTRKSPGTGKVDCKIIDFTWKVENVQLADPFRLFNPGLSPEAAAEAGRVVAEGAITDPRKAAEEAERRIAERERRKREEERRRREEERAARIEAEEIRQARKDAERARRDHVERQRVDLHVRQRDSGIRAISFNPLAPPGGLLAPPARRDRPASAAMATPGLVQRDALAMTKWQAADRLAKLSRRSG